MRPAKSRRPPRIFLPKPSAAAMHWYVPCTLIWKHAYMEDSDASNLASLGHRRWILNPPLQKIGFGLAENGRWSYSAMQIFDDSRSASVPHRFVAYPAAGSFPIDIFEGNYAWSVSLNIEQFDVPELDQVQVEVTNRSTGQRWTLDRNDNAVSDKNDYFNLETNLYGEGYAVIFRPGNVSGYKAGDNYDVRISGLRDLFGNPAEISYTTAFVSVGEINAQSYDPKAASLQYRRAVCLYRNRRHFGRGRRRPLRA